MPSSELKANAASTSLTDETKKVLKEVSDRFAYEDNAFKVLTGKSTKIITGFGPTNAPTAGTLSVMFGVYRLQQTLSIPLTIIISDLGAWNSRNLPWSVLEATAQKMIRFLHAVYPHHSQVEIRTHLDTANLIRAGKIARFLTLDDLMKFKESLQELYRQHNLLGSDVGMVVDTLYTVADVLEPAEQEYENILMVSGFEEGYFVDLSKIVLKNIKASKDITLPMHAEIGALFFQVIEGFSGYPKMSKSIPQSAVNLNQSEEEIKYKLLSDEPNDQKTIFTCMRFASRWDEAMIENARRAFMSRTTNGADWELVKQMYVDEFVGLKKIWHES